MALSKFKKFFSKRNESEKALILTEKRYHDFVTSSRDWIWEINLEGNITYSNHAVTSILGYSLNKLLGKPFTYYIHEDDREEISNIISDGIAKQTGWHNVLNRWQDNQGEWHYLESSSVVMFDDNGRFSGFRGVDRDATARIHAEKAYRENQKTLNNAFDATLDGVCITRLSDGRFIYANPALAKLSYYSLDEIIGKTISELNFYNNPNARNDLIQQLLSGALVSDYQTDFRNKNGEIIPCSISCSLVDLDGDQCIISILRNISDRIAAEYELKKLSTAMDQSHDAIFITDVKGNIEYVNSRLLELTGYSKEELIGNKPNIWKSNETAPEVFDDIKKTILSGEVWTGEILNKKKNDEHFWSSESVSPIIDKKGRISHFLGTQQDITEIRNLNRQLTWQASYDALTHLVNRGEFERRLERIVTHSENKPDVQHALLFMDLDQFKVVNDTCGHTAGDELLRQLSSILLAKVRKRDTLARIGGDEFAVLMEHCSIDHAYRVANNLLETVQEYQFQWKQQVFRIGVSIGLIPITHEDHNTIEILKNADSACYLAKEQGRNRIHVYHLDDQDIAHRHGEMTWVAKIYQALDENRFCLYAQTIASLKVSHTKPNKSYEMLLRMVDESGQTIPPDQFFSAAERYNLATKLDKWVIKNIFNELHGHPDFFRHVEFICINLSGSSLTDNDFLQYIIKQLSKNSDYIDPKKLCFEVTETAAITHLSNASKFIHMLKDLGCKFALDDFGSGLSSFGYLKNLPVDYLKIDGMFVKDIVEDQIDHAMVKSINEIGHVMEMKTIAEYVESDEIKGMLREIGVDYAQGLSIGKPIPLDMLLIKNEYKMDNVVAFKP